MTARNEPRRPSLATIVGSSLAVAAAGSLLAFSSLAEQAGLQGLAVGGLQPAEPERTRGGAQAITIPAPASAPPEDPREALAELVRQTVERGAAERAPEVQPTITFATEPRPARRPNRPDRPERPDRIESPARVAVAGPDAADERESTEWDGPPYGHAYGHYGKKGKSEPKHPHKKHGPKVRPRDDGPVYARTAGDEPARGPKPPKMKKVQKAGDSKAKGHAKHAHANGQAKGKAHAKHAHGKGKAKGKGHAKHGG